jgi:hypothetical protein
MLVINAASFAPVGYCDDNHRIEGFARYSMQSTSAVIAQ